MATIKLKNLITMRIKNAILAVQGNIINWFLEIITLAIIAWVLVADSLLQAIT